MESSRRSVYASPVIDSHTNDMDRRWTGPIRALGNGLALNENLIYPANRDTCLNAFQSSLSRQGSGTLRLVDAQYAPCRQRVSPCPKVLADRRRQKKRAYVVSLRLVCCISRSRKLLQASFQGICTLLCHARLPATHLCRSCLIDALSRFLQVEVPVP